MIPYATIYTISERLEALRTSGMLVFDTRDRGNYSTYELDATWAMLEKEDPTGIAAGLLLAEMLEATLHLSQVKLPRVLLEPDFVSRLTELIDLREQLASLTEGPRAELSHRLSEGLRIISDTFGEVDRRELAVCLRDAIYALSKGLTLHWVSCHPHQPASPTVALSTEVEQHDTMAAFVEALGNARPFGAYLAVIGNQMQTAIGIKQACGTAYLSSAYIDTQFGRMAEHRANNYHMAEHLDLDKMTERYPAWHKMRTSASSGVRPKLGQPLGVAPRDAAPQLLPALTLSDLSRDCVLWLALVVEMARQRMSALAPTHPALTQSLQQALPNPHTELPAVTQAWRVQPLSLAETVEALPLTPWERKQCAEAWEGLTADTLLPQGDTPFSMAIPSRELAPWPDEASLWHYPGGSQQFYALHVKLCALSPGLVGTQDELEAARNTILRRNAHAIAVAWINRQITEFWLTQGHRWFYDLLKPRIAQALTDECVRVQAHDGPLVTHFYTQSPKHKTFRARCWFNAKLEPDRWALFEPNDSRDLVRLLGLDSEGDLPAILQGWVRRPNQVEEDNSRTNWAWNSLSEGHVHELASLRGHACYGVPRNGFMVAKVSLNSASVPLLQLTNSRRTPIPHD